MQKQQYFVSYMYLKCLSLIEGILEDYVVEGIDRKDVFFYQVICSAWLACATYLMLAPFTLSSLLA